ncbi:MAG: hypothetical protein ACFFCW_26575 [Candidatus Hodarchaeota archaeon]
MSAEERVEIRYELTMPREFSIADFEKSVLEFARQEEEMASAFKADTVAVEVDQQAEEFFVGGDVVIPIIIGVVTGLTADAIKFIIKEKLLPHLMQRFGRNVLKERE